MVVAVVVMGYGDGWEAGGGGDDLWWLIMGGGELLVVMGAYGDGDHGNNQWKEI